MDPESIRDMVRHFSGRTRAEDRDNYSRFFTTEDMDPELRTEIYKDFSRFFGAVGCVDPVLLFEFLRGGPAVEETPGELYILKDPEESQLSLQRTSAPGGLYHVDAPFRSMEGGARFIAEKILRAHCTSRKSGEAFYLMQYDGTDFKGVWSPAPRELTPVEWKAVQTFED